MPCIHEGDVGVSVPLTSWRHKAKQAAKDTGKSKDNVIKRPTGLLEEAADQARMKADDALI